MSEQSNTPLFIGMPDSCDFVFDGHAGAGPSGADRWMNCTASLHAARKFLETLTPNQQREFAKSSVAARQGTTAHAAAEVEASVVLGRLSSEEAQATLLELAIMPETDGEAYDEEMGDYIVEYVDLVKTYADDRGPENILIEARVETVVPLPLFTSLNPLNPVHTIPGSTDFAALPTPEHPELVVGDLKYGDGIYVEAEDNSQVKIYGLGVLALCVDEEGNLPEWLTDIRYYIVQPRLGGIKTWSESIDDLLDWRDEVLAPALSLALAGPAGGATYVPSEKACQWCPARGGCAALAEDRMARADDLFDVIVESEFADGPGAFPETGSLDNARLGHLLAQVEGLIKIHADLKAEAQRRLYRGVSVPGYQLVSYTPPRQWADDAAEELVEEADVWAPRKMLTPTQALKAMAAKRGKDADLSDIESKIVSPDKRPVVAREGDRRKTWAGPAPEDLFDDETGEG